MNDDRTIEVFSAELLKEAGILDKLRQVPGWVAPKWDKVRGAAKSIETFGGRLNPQENLGHAALSYGSRMIPGAAIGAVADPESSVRGAMIGAAGGALLPSALRNIHSVGVLGGKLATKPIQTMREGWQASSNVLGHGASKMKGNLQSKLQKIEAGREAGPTWIQRNITRRGMSADEIAEAQRATLQKRFGHQAEIPGGRSTEVGAVKGVTIDPKTGREVHQSIKETWQGAQGAGGKARAMAEELSRRGWTGSGRVTKYLPVGGKGLTGAFMGMSAPTMYRAAKGEGSWGEAAGEIGGNLGFIAAGAMPAMGLIGQMASSELARRAFKAPVGAIERAAGAGHPVAQKAMAQPPMTQDQITQTMQKYYPKEYLSYPRSYQAYLAARAASQGAQK